MLHGLVIKFGLMCGHVIACIHCVFAEHTEMVNISFNPFLGQWSIQREDEGEGRGVSEVCEKMKSAAI